MLPFFFSQSQEFHIRDPGWREEALCRVPARLPEAHALGVIGDNESGGAEVGGEMSCERVVADDVAGFVDECGKRGKIGEMGKCKSFFSNQLQASLSEGLTEKTGVRSLFFSFSARAQKRSGSQFFSDARLVGWMTTLWDICGE